jgi:hypothetical protein
MWLAGDLTQGREGIGSHFPHEFHGALAQRFWGSLIFQQAARKKR